VKTFFFKTRVHFNLSERRYETLEMYHCELNKKMIFFFERKKKMKMLVRDEAILEIIKEYFDILKI